MSTSRSELSLIAASGCAVLVRCSSKLHVRVSGGLAIFLEAGAAGITAPAPVDAAAADDAGDALTPTCALASPSILAPAVPPPVATLPSECAEEPGRTNESRPAAGRSGMDR